MSYLCVCGHVIKEVIFPCPDTGDLKWQTESENASQRTADALKEFFAAVENGEKNRWLAKFFDYGDQRLQSMKIDPDGTQSARPLSDDNFYLTADMATIVIDLISRFERQEGHSVYRCPKCERIYIQKQYGTDDYDCYEKREGYRRF